ncbi:MAG: hypothetical protein RQ875_07245 [Vicingaceae bacterium]|nr:hypothetical protein [Vicingaceae bacterium]
MKLENQTLLVISNEPWGDVWYSKQNWAYELSKKNKVFFINSPKTWSFKGLFSTYIKKHSYSDNLIILDYENRLPLTRFRLISKLNEYLVSTSLKKWLKTQNITSYLFWSFDPYRFLNPKFLNPKKSIYMRVDRYQTPTEVELLKNIDSVIVTAEELIKEINYSGKYLVLSHGISEEEFTPTSEVSYPKGYLIYVGNIDFRLDVELIKKMSIIFSDELFLFIGKVRQSNDPTFSELFIEQKMKNVIIHGVEHFKNLKNYIDASKACLAPMDLTVHGNDVHHHKSLQYLAMGKPIITPKFKDSINKDDMMLYYSNHEEAINLIRTLHVSETKDKVQSRINFAKQFTYNNLIKKVEQFLTESAN